MTIEDLENIENHAHIDWLKGTKGISSWSGGFIAGYIVSKYGAKLHG